MALPFWDPGAIDSSGKTPGITSLIPAATSPYPDELSAWDVIYLNGVRAPGIVRLEGGRHVGLDIRKIIGQLVPEAAILNFDPVPLTLTLVVWTPQHLIELEALVPQIIPKPGPNPVLKAVRAEHPALGLYGITTLYFQSGLLPRHMGRGIVEIDFTAFEWNPDLKLLPKDVGSPLPQGNQPRSTQPTNTVIPPSQNRGLLGP